MSWKFREASNEDLDGIYKIELACFDEIDVFHKDIFEFFLSRSGVIFLLAYSVDTPQNEENNIIGFIIVNPRTFTAFEIITIDVHPKWRSKGIGTKFLEIIEEKIGQKILNYNLPTKSFTIELVVYVENIAAKKLYEKCGYRFVKKLANYYSQGRDGLKMEKKITLD